MANESHDLYRLKQSDNNEDIYMIVEMKNTQVNVKCKIQNIKFRITEPFRLVIFYIFMAAIYTLLHLFCF